MASSCTRKKHVPSRGVEIQVCFTIWGIHHICYHSINWSSLCCFTTWQFFNSAAAPFLLCIVEYFPNSTAHYATHNVPPLQTVSSSITFLLFTENSKHYFCVAGTPESCLQFDWSLSHGLFQCHFSTDYMGTSHMYNWCRDSEVHAVAHLLCLLWTLLTQNFPLSAMAVWWAILWCHGCNCEPGSLTWLQDTRLGRYRGLYS
jgi:hypothetical protein